MKYGLLEVVENIGLRTAHGRRKTFVKARCDCGKEVEVELTRLVTGHKKSCGHLRQSTALNLCVSNERRHALKPLDVGKCFGRLTVVEDLGLQQIGDRKRTLVKVKCACGTEKLVLRTALEHNKHKSCGCKKIEVMRSIGLLGLNKKHVGAAAAHAVFCAYTRKAKERGLAFELTENEFLSVASKPCFYCRSEPSNVYGNGRYNGDFVYSGIDRIDSEKGYHAGNVVSCCEVCNRAKSNMPIAEFMAWTERFRRPQGEVSISKIVDGFGKVISLEQAVKYGWLRPGIGAVHPYTETDTRNLFLDQGRQLLAYAFGFRAPMANYTCQNFGVGTGVTAAKVTDVALEAPITLSNGQVTKPVDMIDFLSAFVVRVSLTLGLADANGYVVSEMGLFSGNNVLIARKIRTTSINKTSDFSPTLSWRIRF